MKSLASLYLDTYVALARKQHIKYGNPTAEQTPPPSHVPGVLERALYDNLITREQSRKLAIQLGRKAYGEVGLTSGVVSQILDKELRFNVMPWHAKAQLESSLCGY